MPEFDLYYTNQSGDGCCRCNSVCSGCRVPEDFKLELKRYDNFKVVTSSPMDQIQVMSGQSQLDYERRRPTLAKCLDEFRTPEIMDEDTVYCQKCKRNTGAEKKVSVQRWPDTLIVYLKRFVYLSEPTPHAKKIETEVVFDQAGLDVTELATPGTQLPDTYDLVGSIQHFGGIHSGHYTAYALDPVSQNWTYYNDQQTKRQEPSERDAKSVYILFYRRRSGQSPEPHLAEWLRSHQPVEDEEDELLNGVNQGHRSSPVNLIENHLTHEDISAQLRKRLGGSVSSLESLKAEGGGSRSSQGSLNLDDFDQETELHQTPIPSPDFSQHG